MKVVRAETAALPGGESFVGVDENVAKRKQLSERDEPLIERMNRIVERMELLERLMKKMSEGEISGQILVICFCLKETATKRNINCKPLFPRLWY